MAADDRLFYGLALQFGLRRVEGPGAADTRLIQLGGLVLLQGDERRDDNAEPLSDAPGDLIDGRLAIATGHHSQHVVSLYCRRGRFDDARPEPRMAEASRYVLESHEGFRTHSYARQSRRARRAWP
jgi:hypothetical protein